MIMFQLPVIQDKSVGNNVIMETISVNYIIRIAPSKKNTTYIWIGNSETRLETVLTYSETLERLSTLKVIDESR